MSRSSLCNLLSLASATFFPALLKLFKKCIRALLEQRGLDAMWQQKVINTIFRRGPETEDSQKHLDMLLSDLETLYWKSLNSVSFESVAQLIQIVENSIPSGNRALTAIQLFFADEDDPNFVFHMQAATKDPEKIKLSSKAELMRGRLNACSRALLEFGSESNQTLQAPQWTICTGP